MPNGKETGVTRLCAPVLDVNRCLRDLLAGHAGKIKVFGKGHDLASAIDAAFDFAAFGEFE